MKDDKTPVNNYESGAHPDENAQTPADAKAAPPAPIKKLKPGEFLVKLNGNSVVLSNKVLFSHKLDNPKNPKKVTFVVTFTADVEEFNNEEAEDEKDIVADSGAIFVYNKMEEPMSSVELTYSGKFAIKITEFIASEVKKGKNGN